MRIYRYRSSEPGLHHRLAVAVGDGAPVDLVSAWIAATGGLEGDLGPYLSSTLRLIEGGPELWRSVREAAEAAPAEAVVDGSAPDFRWLSPLDRMASLRDFLGFESHVL
ncbi:MAG: hypothetical protein JJE05_13525, partial [Actinobacteria bacterium]|nr:hypothetical protein [Actinomycetota bacterium]